MLHSSGREQGNWKVYCKIYGSFRESSAGDVINQVTWQLEFKKSILKQRKSEIQMKIENKMKTTFDDSHPYWPQWTFFLQAQNKLKSIANYSVLGFWGKTGAKVVGFQAVWQNVQHGLDLLPADGRHLKRNQRRALEKPRCSENVLIFAYALKL